MKTLTISRGYEVLLDDADFDVIAANRWFSIPSGGRVYAGRSAQVDGKQRTVLMHRSIMGDTLVDGMVVDHIDGNGLNNQRSNLRVCTAAENSRNKKACGLTSAYSGVSFNSANGKWQVAVAPDEVQIVLGSYESEVVAAGVYNSAAKRLYAGFARLNDVQPMFQDELLEQHVGRQVARIERQMPLFKKLGGNGPSEPIQPL